MTSEDKEQLPSEVTAEDMIDLLMVESKREQRVQCITDTHMHMQSRMSQKYVLRRGTVEMKMFFFSV